MQHIMFPAIGGLLSTMFIALAMYYVAVQPAEKEQTAHQPVTIMVASHPHTKTARE